MVNKSAIKTRLIVSVLALAALLIGAYWNRQSLLRHLAESLVCSADESPSDVILIDHVSENYAFFERARALQQRGLAQPVLVPVLSGDAYIVPYPVARKFVDVMCQSAEISDCRAFEARVHEPISLNLARRAAEEIQSLGSHSVLLVTEGFRSRRSLRVYSSVLRSRGITVHCQPVFTARTPTNWFDSSHGVEQVVLELIKEWYYALIVRP
jgi:uncharacterized SAM-binding protein YcdF (DUF218 family)